MNKVGFHVNSIWFYAVVLHIVASLVFGTLGIIGSLLVNIVMFSLVFTVCRQRRTTVRQWCRVSRIPVCQWGYLLLLTILCFVVANYINAISVMFTENAMTAAMAQVQYHFWESIVIYAVLPALVEELLFRGCIFRGIPDKKTAIIVSSVLFALLHMNFNQMSYAFFMGIFFALAVAVTDNLSMSIAMHLLFNSINLIFAAFGEISVISRIQNICLSGYYPFGASFVDGEGRFYPVVFLVGTITALLSAALALAVLKRMNYQGKDEGYVPVTQNDEYKIDFEKEGVCPESGGVRYSKPDMEKADYGRRKRRGEPILWVVKWKPDGLFWGGCAVCLLIAAAYELLP